MRKGRQELVKAEHNMRCGNHNVVVSGDYRYFYYFGNLVCEVDDYNKTYRLDDCGFGGHSSTTQTLNDYEYWFRDVLGYENKEC